MNMLEIHTGGRAGSEELASEGSPFHTVLCPSILGNLVLFIKMQWPREMHK